MYGSIVKRAPKNTGLFWMELAIMFLTPIVQPVKFFLQIVSSSLPISSLAIGQDVISKAKCSAWTLQLVGGYPNGIYIEQDW